jgi:DNA gyrase/topoisomerase IV subunit A
VTLDGYGKRIAVEEIRRTDRGVIGVTVSKVPIGAALVVDDSTPELILQSKAGKTQRMATSSVPRRRRRHSSRGVRVMRLDPWDEVASVAPVRDEVDARGTQAPAAGLGDPTPTSAGTPYEAEPDSPR